MRDLTERDRHALWHPYTQHALTPECLPVVRAQGAYLQLEDGRRILDGISSWWVNLHGHGHPAIAQAIHQQALELDHVMFAQFTHAPGVELAETIGEALRQRTQQTYRAFYSDNGSTAVETALKMAYQFQIHQGHHRPRFLALRGSYHGDTFGCMAVGGGQNFHTSFDPLLFAVDFIAPDDHQALEDYFREWGAQCAAFIFEPLIQAAGGMRMYSASFLQRALDLCRYHRVLSIADEVFTGFYRTGTLFAFEQTSRAPDLVCLSKGLTGGVLPLAVTMATDSTFQAFLGPHLKKAFLHGHSYTGNPIACAAALASWRLLHSPDVQERIHGIAQRTRHWVQRLGPGSRGLGTIGAYELDGEQGYFSDLRRGLTEGALESGVLLRPLGNVLYACPPYCISDEEVDHIYQTMEQLCASSPFSSKRPASVPRPVSSTP